MRLCFNLKLKILGQIHFPNDKKINSVGRIRLACEASLFMLIFYYFLVVFVVSIVCIVCIVCIDNGLWSLAVDVKANNTILCKVFLGTSCTLPNQAATQVESFQRS